MLRRRTHWQTTGWGTSIACVDLATLYQVCSNPETKEDLVICDNIAIRVWMHKWRIDHDLVPAALESALHMR